MNKKAPKKEQETSPEEELNKMEESNVSYIEFKVTTIRMHNSINNRETIKKDESEMKQCNI